MEKEGEAHMRKVIDFHAHVGDIFHENKNITFKTNIKKGNYDDPFIRCEKSGYTEGFLMDGPESVAKIIHAGQYRCWEWTLENMSKEMDELEEKQVAMQAVLLPVLPNTSFEEYLAASKLDNRLIAFTSIDFTLSENEIKEKLKKDIERGAKGLKLHPTLQNKSLRDKKVAAAMEVFKEADLPVITHVGMNPYYTPDKPYPTNPAFSAMEEFFWFAHEYSDCKVVAAHCCGAIEELAAGVKGLEHVYTDTTMCSAEKMRKGVEILGADKILFGTDVPFGTFKYSVLEMEKAFAGEPEIADMTFYKNAAKLMHLI